MLNADPAVLSLADGRVGTPDGRGVTLAEVCTRAYYGAGQHQIGATASCLPDESPPPFLASFAEVSVDVETGLVAVLDYVAAVDCGTPINPRLAEGQVEGAVANGIGYALTEEFLFTPGGRVRNADLSRYKIPGSYDLPPIRVILGDSPDTSPPRGRGIAAALTPRPLPLRRERGPAGGRGGKYAALPCCYLPS